MVILTLFTSVNRAGRNALVQNSLHFVQPGGGNKHGSFSTASSIPTSQIPFLPLAPHVTHHEHHRERSCNKDEDRDSSQQESGCHDPDHQSYHSLATTLQFRHMLTILSVFVIFEGTLTAF